MIEKFVVNFTVWRVLRAPKRKGEENLRGSGGVTVELDPIESLGTETSCPN